MRSWTTTWMGIIGVRIAHHIARQRKAPPDGGAFRWRKRAECALAPAAAGRSAGPTPVGPGPPAGRAALARFEPLRTTDGGVFRWRKRAECAHAPAAAGRSAGPTPVGPGGFRHEVRIRDRLGWRHRYSRACGAWGRPGGARERRRHRRHPGAGTPRARRGTTKAVVAPNS